MTEILSRQNSLTFLVKFLHASLLGVTVISQRALVDTLGTIRTRMGKHNRSKMVAVDVTLRSIPSCISNQ
jgi:hypothetical protein